MQRTCVHWSFILKSGNCWMGVIRFDLFSHLPSTCSVTVMHLSNNQDSHFFLYWRNSIIITRQWSCGKVMFSLACVCSQGWGLYAWSQVSSWWVCQVSRRKVQKLRDQSQYISKKVRALQHWRWACGTCCKQYHMLFYIQMAVVSTAIFFLFSPSFSFFLEIKVQIYMSHFAYACKTEGKNGISRLISGLCANCLISILEYSRLNHLDVHLV